MITVRFSIESLVNGNLGAEKNVSLKTMTALARGAFFPFHGMAMKQIKNADVVLVQETVTICSELA